MATQVQTSRLRRELGDLERDPPPGIICHPVDDDDMTHLEAFLKGPPDSPYEKGTFRLDIRIPVDYPFNPPTIKFKTMIYHPNVDEGGIICLSILKKIEKDGWTPSLSIQTALKSIQILMGEPNPHDPLDAEIAKEFEFDHALFVRKAKEFTIKYATGEQTNIDTTTQKSEREEHDSFDILSQRSLNATERSNRPTERKSKLSLSTKNRKSKVSLSSLPALSSNNENSASNSQSNASSSTMNTQNDDLTPPLQSLLLQHQNTATIETANEKNLDESHIPASTSSSSSFSNSPRKSNVLKFDTTTNRDDEIDDDVGSTPSNGSRDSFIYIDKDEETDNCSKRGIIILDDELEIDELESTPLSSQPLSDDNDVKPPLSKSNTNLVNSTATEKNRAMNNDFALPLQSNIQDMTSSSQLKKENDSCEKPQSITTDKKSNIVDYNKDPTETICATTEKGAVQQDYPELLIKNAHSSNMELNRATSITTTVTKRVPLQESQSSQNILDPLPTSLSIKIKDKGKAVCRPSTTYSSQGEVPKNSNIFSATDNENYMPKKRIIDTSMKNKLSLSRTKRQKS